MSAAALALGAPSSPGVTFRPVTDADLGMLHEWITRPHAALLMVCERADWAAAVQRGRRSGQRSSTPTAFAPISTAQNRTFAVDAPTRQPVTLEPAGPDEAPVLGNLLELYVHDLSALFGLEVGVDGRFGYAHLPLYFAEPRTRRAYLIRSGASLAGFALVRAQSPFADLPVDFDVAEFFILRAHRRHGLGRDAASALWDHHPGTWMVRVADANMAAVAFWKATIEDYAGACTEHRRTVDGRGWHVFVFSSRSRPA